MRFECFSRLKDTDTDNYIKMSISENTARGMISSAILAQNEGRFKDALKLFEAGLGKLLEVLRSEALDSATKSKVTHDVQSYMVMAESCKSQLQKADNKQSTIIVTNDPVVMKKKIGSIPDVFDYSKPKRLLNTSSSSVNRAPSKSPVRSTRSSTLSISSNSESKKIDIRTKSDTKTNCSDQKLSENELQILNEMLDTSPGISFDDIAGLALAKQTLQEAVILPNIRPDLFTGLRSPCKGVLLFGPPGTGKTLLAKAVATESGFTFFSITASSVTSKYVGEGEKLMKTLFDLARKKQPSVIFFDEIDALMSARKESEHEASRRLKTEFMVQVDGTGTNNEDRILVMAATNTPWALDEAVLRRMPKRVYVPLPDSAARRSLLSHLLKEYLESRPTIASSIVTMIISGSSSTPKPGLSDVDLDEIVGATDGYSGSDLAALCREAAMEPIREMPAKDLRTVSKENLRSLRKGDFMAAIRRIRPSVSPDSLATFSQWSDSYGAK